MGHPVLYLVPRPRSDLEEGEAVEPRHQRPRHRTGVSALSLAVLRGTKEVEGAAVVRGPRVGHLARLLISDVVRFHCKAFLYLNLKHGCQMARAKYFKIVQ